MNQKDKKQALKELYTIKRHYELRMIRLLIEHEKRFSFGMGFLLGYLVASFLFVLIIYVGGLV